MGVVGGPDPIVTDELILLLDAGNSKSYPGSGTTWFDISGKENDATMTNATWNSNGYWLFDGTSDYGIISSLSGFTNTTNVTVFCIFKPTFAAGSGNNGGRGALLGFGSEAASTNDIYHFGSDDNTFGLNTWSSNIYGVDNIVNYDDDVIAGTFQFKFGGSDTAGFNMFINGQDQSESQTKGSAVDRTRSTRFGIGCNGWYTANQTWTGRIYYIAIYNDSVTTAKALQNYQFYNNNSRFE